MKGIPRARYIAVAPPEGLGRAGVSAWGRAMRALGGHPDPHLLWEAAARYAFACDLAHESRQAWFALDQPLIVQYSNGIEAPHATIRTPRVRRTAPIASP
jgi:hypothetical protein